MVTPLLLFWKSSIPSRITRSLTTIVRVPLMHADQLHTHQLPYIDSQCSYRPKPGDDSGDSEYPGHN
jgi:hypothetical protein